MTDQSRKTYQATVELKSVGEMSIPVRSECTPEKVAELVADVQRQNDNPHQYGPGAVEDLRDRLADALTALSDRDAAAIRVHRALAPDWMSIVAILGGDQSRYDQFVRTIVDAVLTPGGDNA